jgi:hypothetical protein
MNWCPSFEYHILQNYMYVNVRLAKSHIPRVQGLRAKDILRIFPHIPTLEFIFINLFFSIFSLVLCLNLLVHQ